MSRFASTVVMIAALLLLAAGPASAAPVGNVLIIPGDSTDLAAIRLRTSAGCPQKADAYYARLFGHGFPSDGIVAAANTSAGLNHTAGFDVYLSLTMKDFAQDHNTTLTGKYDIVVYCIDSFTQNSFGEFTGSLRFSTPTRYTALGAAKPNGTPPTPIGVGEPVPIPSGGGEVPLSQAPAAQGAAPGADPQAGAPGVGPGDSPEGINLLPILLVAAGAFGVIVVVAVVRRWRRRGTAAGVAVLLLTATAAVLAGPHAQPAAAEEAGQPEMTIGVVIPTTTSTTQLPPTTTTQPTTTTTEPTGPPTTGPTPTTGGPPAARGGTPGGGGGLSYTGSPVGVLLAAGLALLAAGAAVLTAVRRGRSTEGSSHA